MLHFYQIDQSNHKDAVVLHKLPDLMYKKEFGIRQRIYLYTIFVEFGGYTYVY